MGTDNLVDFVKDFNHEYLVRADAHDADKRTWRTEVLAFDNAKEARLSLKELQAAHMDQKFYELEVEMTKNMGNMTTTLFMLATFMDTLTMYCCLHASLPFVRSPQCSSPRMVCYMVGILNSHQVIKYILPCHVAFEQGTLFAHKVHWSW